MWEEATDMRARARACVVSAGQGGVLGLVRQGYLGLYM